MEKKTDRRTLKTKKALQNGLAELLAEKELRKITVQEVADKADVNRVTFYKHYYDIYDLYEQTEKEILSELGVLTLNHGANLSEDFSRELIGYIEKRPEFFKMIFSPHNTGTLRDKLTRMIEGVFRLIYSEKNDTDLYNTKLDYYCTYHSQGCIAIIEKWISSGFTQDKAFVIKTITDLDAAAEAFIASRLG